MREKAAEGRGLYRPEFEHDACGIGAVVDIQGRASHETVDDALKIVEKLEHRAGKDAEGKTGDGVGILTQIPHAFFARAAAEASIALPGRRDYGVGMFFLPRDGLKRRQAQRQFELVTEKEGMAFLGWREVPVHPEILGQRARDKMPSIFQAFVARPEETAPGLDFDRKLYVARRVFEHLSGDTYVVSLSSRTVVYKGMFLVHQLRAFYPDLQSINYTSALAIVHSRFSTNTNPSWERAHPNRLIAHNGEINTIRGNMDRMLAREETMFSPLLATDRDKVLPVVNASGSDSAMLDNTLEFLMMAGMDLPLAVMACIPEPWRNDCTLSRSRRDLYHYYATLMEPWDGPAAILFSDGDVVGAVLDRNGLRPARYYLTDDSRLILSSEVGVLDIPPEHIVEKSRLRPGKMLLADLRQGQIIDDQELKEGYAARQPYGEWLDTNLLRLADLPIPNQRVERHSREELIEMSEMMATANAKSIEEIKSFLSRQKEVYKIPYETHPADRPRQCVFGGTSNALDFLPLDRSGNRRFIPVMVYPEQAEVHILEDEAASRAYIEQMWAEAMEIYRSGRFKLAFSPAMQRYLKEHQRDFMPEDTKAGMIQAYLDKYTGSMVCSKQIYKEALNHAFDEPKQWEIREINEIMNQCISGWRYFPNPRMFSEYGRQKGWERENPATDSGNPSEKTMDGFVEVTEQMELPF